MPSRRVPQNDPTLMFVNAGMCRSRLLHRPRKRPIDRDQLAKSAARAEDHDLDNSVHRAPPILLRNALNFSSATFQGSRDHSRVDLLTGVVTHPGSDAARYHTDARPSLLRKISGFPSAHNRTRPRYFWRWATRPVMTCWKSSTIMATISRWASCSPTGRRTLRRNLDLVFMHMSRRRRIVSELATEASTRLGLEASRRLQVFHDNYDTDAFRTLSSKREITRPRRG